MEKTKDLYGLVLSGGKSTRMGRDKGTIAYHGIPQWEYLYGLLNTVCEHTFVSIRQEQTSDFPASVPVILDRNEYRGPFNGLLSAYHQNPEASWLVLACDLPLMNLDHIKHLIQGRDNDKLATAFATLESGLPEPLAAIWESKGLKAAIAYLKNASSSCPRKFLINSETALVFPKDDQVLLNANSEEDYKKVLKKLAII